MMNGRPLRRVLVVSANDAVYQHIVELLPSEDFFPILKAPTAGDATRNLPDGFGTELALDLSHGTAGVFLLVKNDYFDQICYKVENDGILTVAKPGSRQTIYGAIKLLAAMSAKLGKMEKKNRTLQEKMEDIRAVNRAKWLLIENLKMTEKDAHYYIEKQAMDTRLSRKEVAENIIRTYDN